MEGGRDNRRGVGLSIDDYRLDARMEDRLCTIDRRGWQER